MSIARPQKSDRGFTLVELMVVAVIVMILAIGISRLFTRQVATFAVQDETSRMQQQARVAEDVMVRTIQQAGGMTKKGTESQRVEGGAILSASDHHITVQYDDPAYDDGYNLGVITPREVVTFVVGNDSATCANNVTLPEFTVSMTTNYMTSNYVVSDYVINNISTPICKPPYKLYRITLDPTSPTTAVSKELLAENVDNLVFRYYDASRSQIMADTTATPPIWYGDLPSGETVLSTIRMVDVELTLRTEKADREYTGTYIAPAGTVGSYTSGTASTSAVTVTDGFRRRTYKSLITPGNINPNECGEIKLATTQANPQCPAPTTITATVKRKDGTPFDGGLVTFLVASGPAPDVNNQLGFDYAGGVGVTTIVKTADSVGVATVNLNYIGTSTSIVVQAQAQPDCLLSDSVTINFLPGLSADIALSTNNFTGTLLETCLVNTISFTATTYDQCGNLVPPQPGYSIGVYDQAAPAAAAFLGELNGTGAPVDLISSPQTFTVKAPTVLTATAAAARDPLTGKISQYVREATRPSPVGTNLWVRNVTTPDGSLVNGGIYTIESIPWPPDNFTTISDGINGVTVSDCAGPLTLTATFGINDCNNIPIWNLLLGTNPGTYKTTANQDKALSVPANTLSDPQMGVISGIVAGASYIDTGKTTIDYSAASGGVYTLNWAKPECEFGPPAFPPTVSPLPSPHMEFKVAGVTTAPHVMMPKIQPCRTCSIQITPNPVSTCDGKALITVTKCQQTEEPVILTVTGSSEAKWMEYNPATGVVTTLYGSTYNGKLSDNGAGDVTLEMWLDVEDVPVNTPLTIEATSDPVGKWSCQSTLTVGNTCQNMKAYYTTLDSQGIESTPTEIVYGTTSLCAAVVNRLYFELTRCSYGTLNPQNITVGIYQHGILVDSETVNLAAYPQGTFPADHFRNVSGLNVVIFPDANFTPAVGNDILELPDGDGVQLYIQKWTNLNQPNEYCPATDQYIDFIKPLPICFPNAITSGGGASWNGNVKVHWGDVVVRGHIDGINAAKQIYKDAAGQFDGSSYAGYLSDRFVDFYVGKEGNGAVGDGQYQDAIPGWLPTTAYALKRQIIPAGSAVAFEVVTAGTSGVAAPSWPSNLGDTVTDGTVKWQACVYQPYKGTNYGNYFGNISKTKINEMIVTLVYEEMKDIALTYSSGSYWFAVPSSDVGKLVTLPNGQSVKLKTLYNDKTYQTADLIDVLNVSPITGKNVYYNGDYIFVDTYGNSVAGGPPTRPTGLTGEDIDIAGTVTIVSGKFSNSLPKHSISGDFFTKGIVYIAGNIDFSGIGSKTVRPGCLTPPLPESNYAHNSKPFTENDLPIRPTPGATSTNAFNLSVHFDGAVYVDGYFGGNGNPFFYGAITAEKGYESGGEPEVWYNYALNVSGVKGALCVLCCNIEPSARVLNIPVGSEVDIEVYNAWGDVIWNILNKTVADISWTDPSRPYSKAKIKGIGVGKTSLYAADMNNCTAVVEINVYNPCTGYYMDPAIYPLAAGGYKLGDIVTMNVTDGTAPYPSGNWAWTQTPSGTTPSAKVFLGITTTSTNTATAQACGIVTVAAKDLLGICTDTYESVLTVSSDFLAAWPAGPFKTGNTMTVTTSGASASPLVWTASPAGNVQITPNGAGPGTAVIKFLLPGNVTINVADPAKPGCDQKYTYNVTCQSLALSLNPPLPGPYLGTQIVTVTAAGGSGQQMSFLAPLAKKVNVIAPNVAEIELWKFGPASVPVTVTDPGYGGAACPNTITITPIL